MSWPVQSIPNPFVTFDVFISGLSEWALPASYPIRAGKAVSYGVSSQSFDL